MASIHKRENKDGSVSYQLKWRDPDGSPRGKNHPTLRSAKAHKLDVEECVAQGRRWEPRDAVVLPEISEVMTAFVRAQKRKLGESGVETCIRLVHSLNMFDRFLAEEIPRRRTVDVLSLDLLERYWDWLTDTPSRHGRPRTATTKSKAVSVVQRGWAWAANRDEYAKVMPPVRSIDLQWSPGSAARAPTWEQMDAALMSELAAQDETLRRALWLERCQGLRVAQATRLEWPMIDLDDGVCVLEGRLGKSKQERRGRVIALAPVLIKEMAGWGKREGYVVPFRKHKHADRRRLVQASRVRAVWDSIAKANGIRPEVYKQPNHAFRKGFCTGLRRLGADRDAIEVLVGHSRGVRGVYDEVTLDDLRAAVALVPAVGQTTAAVPLKERQA